MKRREFSPTPGPFRVGPKQDHGTEVKGIAPVAWCGANYTYNLKENKSHSISPDEAYDNAVLFSFAPIMYIELKDTVTWLSLVIESWSKPFTDDYALLVRRFTDLHNNLAETLRQIEEATNE